MPLSKVFKISVAVSVAILLLTLIAGWLWLANLDTVTEAEALQEVRSTMDLNDEDTIEVVDSCQNGPDTLTLFMWVNGDPLEARCQNRLFGTGLFGMLKCELTFG